jgi:hypothetical protein
MQRMRRPRNLVTAGIAVCLVLTLSAASFAAGRGYVDGKGRIHGCVGAHGALSVVKAGHSCPAHTTDLIFDQRGPAGTVKPSTWVPITAGTAGVCASGGFCATATTSWSNYLNGFAPAAYSVDGEGVVRVRGLVHTYTAGSCDGSANAVILKLPFAARPANAEVFMGAADDLTAEGAAEVYVEPDGTVVCNDAAGFPSAGLNFLSLSGISFLAAPPLPTPPKA